jgi:hypothetical protein
MQCHWISKLRFVAFVAPLSVLVACGAGNAQRNPEMATQVPDAAAPAASTTAAVASDTAKTAEVVPPTKDAPDPPLPQAAAPVVTLLEAGAEPRRPLRYAFQLKTERVQMDLKMVMQLSMGSRETPKVTMPTIRTVLKVVPTKIDRDGSLSARSDVVSIEVMNDSALPKEVREKLKKELGGMVGIKGAMTIESRGIVRETTIDLPKDASPTIIETLESMKDSLRNMTHPFPVEAVGEGAKWDTKSVLATKFTFAQTSHVVLTKVSDRDAALATTVTQEASAQAMKPPASLPPNASVHLDSFTGTGEATSHVNLRSSLPSSATANAKNRSQTTILMGEKKIVTDTRLELTLTTKTL